MVRKLLPNLITAGFVLVLIYFLFNLVMGLCNLSI
jgi:hypothetical protein